MPPALPGDSLLKVAGLWRVVDDIAFTVTSGGTIPRAQFVYPTACATEIDSTISFEWTAVPNALYRLTIGSSAGASDLYNSGDLELSWHRVSRTLPESRTIYARVTVIQPGGTASTDIAFTVRNQ